MRSMRGFLLLICGFISALFAEKMQAKVTLPTIWGNHMVLQQRAEVRFSGTAKSNRKVTITTSWDKKKTTTTTDKEGNWTATVATPAAGGPYSIVFSDGEELTLSDILIGEVWFCSGQSNMEMPVRGFRGQPVYGSQNYIVSADSKRSLRLFTVKRSWSTRPKTDGVTGYWTPLSPKEVGDFSATAYFFGEQLQKTLGIPVGLIHCSWSASRIEAWMSRETLRSFDDVKLPDEDATDLKAYAQTPTLLWNAMVYPWQGVPVKGVIWYQGEANSAAPQLYKRLFPAMVAQWRTFFQNPDMPFYYVQIAPYRSDAKDGFTCAEFRQCQLELMKEVPHVGMVTTTDAGSERFIHPPHKIKVGQRLAYWALAKTYSIPGFLYSGPIYKTYTLKKNVIELTFDYGQEGLIPENERLKGFEIVDKKGKIFPAEAEIINGSARVKVWNDAVAEPAEVRYCYRNYMEGNLFNNAEIPASPFRVVLNAASAAPIAP